MSTKNHKDSNRLLKRVSALAAGSLLIAGTGAAAHSDIFSFEDLGDGATVRSKLLANQALHIEDYNPTAHRGIEASCGESGKKAKEGNCGAEGKAEEGTSPAESKAKEANCGAEGKAKEGNCGAEGEAKEEGGASEGKAKEANCGSESKKKEGSCG